MLKKLLLPILLSFSLTSFAGEVDEAIERGSNVVLFLNMPQCGYCQMFEPRFEKATQKYSDKYSFFNVNIESEYGKSLMYKYRATHVPFVMLMNNKKIKSIPAHCLLDTACFNKELESFR